MLLLMLQGQEVAHQPAPPCTRLGTRQAELRLRLCGRNSSNSSNNERFQLSKPPSSVPGALGGLHTGQVHVWACAEALRRGEMGLVMLLHT